PSPSLPAPRPRLFPYTTLFRSDQVVDTGVCARSLLGHRSVTARAPGCILACARIPATADTRCGLGPKPTFGASHRLGDLLSAGDAEVAAEPIGVALDRAHSHAQFTSDLRTGSTGDDERTDLPLPGSQLAVSLTPCLTVVPLGSEASGQGRAPAGEIGHRGPVGLGDR